MDTALWDLGRSAGVVALVLLTLSVVLGILTGSGRRIGRLPRFGVQLVHRNVSLLACVFVVVHVVTLLLDPQAQLTIVDTVVPFLGASNPLWLGLGTLGVDLLLAIIVTALLRRWVGRRAFRVVHWLTYPLWAIAVGHTLGEGTDATTPWLIGTTVVCAAGVLGAVAGRLSSHFRPDRSIALEQSR